MAALSVVYFEPKDLNPYPRNARRHSNKQIRQIADSIRTFGFTNPILIDAQNMILAGHGRVEAAKILNMATVPCVRIETVTPDQRRAYILADNKLALNAGWDQEILAIELQGLVDLGFDMTVTGFSLAEADFILDAARDGATDTPAGPEDVIPLMSEDAVTRMGDLWRLGRHRLICGDARNVDDYERLLAGETVDLIFTDPPYNVPIDGHVCGSGRIRHREFAMGVGEMSSSSFTAFLSETLGAAAKRCRDGAIAFVCMDWRHMSELLTAGRAAFSELKNLCVWNKTNGGMGSFYRSKHELVFVFKVGTAPHVNSFGLGDTGRYRTNVWDYPGISSMGTGRMDELSMHPTVKPAALVADAIRDCSRRGDIVLDCFGGSGTTLIAAETCGRGARLIEYDPAYCDTIVLRWERMTGKPAILSSTDKSFEDMAAARLPIITGLSHE
ncbi:site-specific DNA-methyltransferase [Methylocapsa sp. D3K7]|uniref:site-specific DNA-methyltransferase n=1 Tax=Methylocapsa sp. D3K7 TaxID=3041435 RepID=UPI00244E86D2|nr:DNA methyltransferase [Methylocapsa sp. D3K7]WGJ15301.1 site-specific DNA-methyltransferase [Methylocapsa sp. D3K7]